MKKSYTNPEFKVIKLTIVDAICTSPVEQYVTEVNTNPGGWDGPGDDEDF